MTSVIQNALIVFSLLITVAILHAIFFCFSVDEIGPDDNLDTNSDSDSDEIYHSDTTDTRQSEDDEEYDGDDEQSDQHFPVFFFYNVSNVLFSDDEYSNDEDSNSDEEDGHRNEDVYRYSHGVIGVGNINQRWTVNENN